MADKDALEFEKCCQKTVDSWFKDVGKLHLDLTKINEQIEASGGGVPRDLELRRKSLMGEFDKRVLDLELKLKALPVPETMEEKVMKTLPKIVQDTIRRKGVPLSESLTLKPSLDIDFKAKRIKEASLTLEWRF